MFRLIALSSLLALAGCSGYPKGVFTGSQSCNYIGCETGGLVFYPHEENGAIEQPKRWHNWEYGKTSSAYPVGSEEYMRLKQQEVEALKAKGLDPQGRPLEEQAR
jgi:hypothetical protein